MAPVLAAAAPSAPPGDLNTKPHQQDLKSVRKEITTLQKDIAQKEAVRKEAESTIVQSARALETTNAALDTLEQKQSTSSQQLAELQQQLRAVAARVAETRTRVGQMLRRQYKAGQHDSMQLMLGGGNPNQNARDLNYYRHIAQAQQQLIDDMGEQQRQLAQLEQQVQTELQRLGLMSDAKLREQRQLVQVKSKSEQQASLLQQEIRNKQARLVTLKEDEQRLANLIAEINRRIEAQRREAARKAAEARRAREQAAREAAERRKKQVEEARKQGKPVPKAEPVKPQPEEAVEDVADGSAAGKAFQSLKGKMKMPVAGSIAGRFGTSRSEGSSWKGLFIRTAAGQPVRVVADGQVVYADALRGFGNAVIVDHGGYYMTVYTGLSSMAKSAGSKVSAGDTLGASGQLDDGSTGLYFELRYLGKPINPTTWIR